MKKLLLASIVSSLLVGCDGDTEKLVIDNPKQPETTIPEPDEAPKPKYEWAIQVFDRGIETVEFGYLIDSDNEFVIPAPPMTDERLSDKHFNRFRKIYDDEGNLTSTAFEWHLGNDEYRVTSFGDGGYVSRTENQNYYRTSKLSIFDGGLYSFDYLSFDFEIIKCSLQPTKSQTPDGIADLPPQCTHAGQKYILDQDFIDGIPMPKKGEEYDHALFVVAPYIADNLGIQL